jgi:hypothetical protein
MQIKITLRFPLTLVRIAIIKTPLPRGVGEDMGKKEPFCIYTSGGNASWCNLSGKKIGSFLKI